MVAGILMKKTLSTISYFTEKVAYLDLEIWHCFCHLLAVNSLEQNPS
jgi:hypothetical protein